MAVGVSGEVRIAKYLPIWYENPLLHRSHRDEVMPRKMEIEKVLTGQSLVNAQFLSSNQALLSLSPR